MTPRPPSLSYAKSTLSSNLGGTRVCLALLEPYIHTTCTTVDMHVPAKTLCCHRCHTQRCHLAHTRTPRHFVKHSVDTTWPSPSLLV